MTPLSGGAGDAASIAAVALAYYFTRLSHVLLFWLAFVLTRPFGATLGDVLTKPHAKGGLDFGTVGSSAILAGVLVVLVVIAIRAQRQQPLLQAIPLQDSPPR